MPGLQHPLRDRSSRLDYALGDPVEGGIEANRSRVLMAREAAELISLAEAWGMGAATASPASTWPFKAMAKSLGWWRQRSHAWTYCTLMREGQLKPKIIDCHCVTDRDDSCLVIGKQAFQ